MQRSDRLFRLLGLLSDGQPHTAADLAGSCGVSTRTIWRDMDLLAGSGLPVEGTRGAGYRLLDRVPLPPLTLSPLEIEALRLGLQTVADEADVQLQGAARSLAAKIEAALPGHGDRDKPAASGLGRPAFAHAAGGFAHMPLLRSAIAEGRKLVLHFGPGEAPPEVLRPLRMDYQGGFWSLTGYSETLEDFRVLQVHRIHRLEPTGKAFAPEPGKRIEDYLLRFAGGPDGN